ncbi:hypothetical protein ACFY0Z_30140 [Streptomyces kronopolitis]|uniref:hypothetical protein n=1 Tax=Streptomyces kronopolitis TaxID=1612435 RepID=UPI003681F3BF
MEILVSNGTVSVVEERDTAQALQARAVANYLPRPALVEAARIVHNEDENYTGIRFNTKIGYIELMLPIAPEFEYTLVHIAPDATRILKFKVQRRSRQPRQVAYALSEFLRTRGIL